MLDQRILDHFERDTGFKLEQSLVMACYVGSISHNTHDPQPGTIDDVDYMLVVQPPVERLLGLEHWEHWRMQFEELDVVAYSLEKYVRLLLNANPNVLGTLWLRPEHYLHRHAAFGELQINRQKFSSLRAADSFGGYAYGQLRRMEADQAYRGYMGAKRKALVDQHGYDTKNAAHTIRLFRMGVEFVQTGTMQVFREDAADLKAIKRGEWTREQVLAEASGLDAALTQARDGSPLPSQPDCVWADQYLVKWGILRATAAQRADALFAQLDAQRPGPSLWQALNYGDWG